MAFLFNYLLLKALSQKCYFCLEILRKLLHTYYMRLRIL